MATRFSGTGQFFTNTLGLGVQTEYTVSCWVKLDSNRVTTCGFWCITTSGDVAMLATASDGVTAGYWGEEGQHSFAVLTVGTWYHMVATVNGVNDTLYWRALTDTSYSSTSDATATSTTFDQLQVGTQTFNTATNWIDGCITALKIWHGTGASMTLAQVTAEGIQHAPVKKTNLTAWYPLIVPETPDYSGNGHTLAGGAGATYEDGPNLFWGTDKGPIPHLVHPGRTPGRPRRFGRTWGPGFSPATATTASAAAASGTGTAYDATVNIQPNAAAATGTGTANNSTVNVAPNAAAATGTGTANNPNASIAANAAAATGTGTANNPTVNVAANAVQASGTGTANNPNASIAVNASAALGVGTAYDATITTAPFVIVTGIAQSANHPGRGPAAKARFYQRSAGFTGQTGNVFATEALGVGTAYDASVSIAVNSVAAAGTGSANTANPNVAPGAGTASATGTAYDASVSIAVNSVQAAGTGTALGPNPNVAPTVLTAAATGAASDASTSVVVNAAAAVTTGTAFDAFIPQPLVLGSKAVPFHPGRGPSLARFRQHPPAFTPPTGSGPASTASATGTAYDASVSITITPSAPSGTGSAYDAALAVAGGAVAATASGAAYAGAGGVFAGPGAALVVATGVPGAPLVLARPAGASGGGASADVAPGFDTSVVAGVALARALPNGLWIGRRKTSITSRTSSGSTARENTGTTTDPG